MAASAVYHLYPNITAAIAAQVDEWAKLIDEGRDSFVLEALDNLDSGRDDIEIAGRFSTSGKPEMVNLAEPMLQDIAGAASKSASAQRHLEATVKTAVAGGGNVSRIAEAAGVTRQTVYRWAADAE